MAIKNFAALKLNFESAIQGTEIRLLAAYPKRKLHARYCIFR